MIPLALLFVFLLFVFVLFWFLRVRFSPHSCTRYFSFFFINKFMSTWHGIMAYKVCLLDSLSIPFDVIMLLI
jgi:hypothetical protein